MTSFAPNAPLTRTATAPRVARCAPTEPAGPAASDLGHLGAGRVAPHELPETDDLVDLSRPSLIAERTAAFVAEHGATGVLGLILARRAATLACRMETLADREWVASDARARQAVTDLDAERAAQLDQRIDLLTDIDPGNLPEDLRWLLEGFEESPAGLAHLIGFWVDLHRAVRAGNDRAIMQARELLDACAGTAQPPEAPSDPLIERIEAEIDRLRLVVLTQTTALLRQAAADRAEVALLARFDPSPAAAAARRHEAAAEQGFYRALKAIRALRKGPLAEATPTPVGATPGDAAPPTGPPPPAEPLGSFRSGAPSSSGPLGSFGAGSMAAVLGSFRAGDAASDASERDRTTAPRRSGIVGASPVVSPA